MEVVSMPHSHDIAVFDEEVNAISLSIEEIQLQQGFRKEQYLEGRAPDREVAIHDFEIESRRLLLFLSDQRLARSIEKAIDDDATAFAEVSTEEDRARGIASRISGEYLGAEDIEGSKGAAEGIENIWTLEGNPPTRSVKNLAAKAVLDLQLHIHKDGLMLLDASRLIWLTVLLVRQSEPRERYLS